MPFLQPASSVSDKVDSVFLLIFALSVVFLVGITATMVYFVVRYSRRRNPEATNIEGHLGLEITWTVVPLLLFLAMFYFGWTSFCYMRSAPRDAMVVEVTGRQWSWSFKYPNGRVTPELYLALDRPVKLNLNSADVVHGFFIPAFRVKSDVVPGRTNYLWFSPTLLGSFDIECTVICGVSHTYMLSKAHVVTEDAFKAWYFGPDDAPPPAPAAGSAAPAKVRVSDGSQLAVETKPAGLLVLEAKGCLACHSLDGSVKVGPTFRNRFGSRDVVVRDGKEDQVTLDAQYFRRAVQEPSAEIVKGYPPVMPSLPLTKDELTAVMAYIRTLSSSDSGR